MLPEPARHFAAILSATPTRAAVLRHLLLHPDGSSSAEIAAALELSTTVALSHLADLEALGAAESPAQRLASGRRQRGGLYRLKRRAFSAEELHVLMVATGVDATRSVPPLPSLDGFTDLELIAELHRRLEQQEWNESADGRVERRLDQLG